MTTRFYLRGGAIQCALRNGPWKKRFSIGLHCPEKYWNSEKQRAERKYMLSADINKRLSAIEERVLDCRTKAGDDNEKFESLYFGKSSAGKNDLFLPFFSRWATEGTATKIHPRRVDLYSYRLVKEFTRDDIRFDEIDYSYYTELLMWMRRVKHLRVNSMATHIKNIKAVMNEAYKQGLHSNLAFRRFAKPSEETDSVYLSQAELDKLRHLKLSALQERVRDLFLLGCYTAMRYSDYSRICPEWIKEGKIYFTEVKTNNRDCIPLSDNAAAILRKYDGYAPKVTQQKLNEIIKPLCLAAGITEPVQVTRLEGDKKVCEIKEKWELVTSHTARRTGATLLIKAGAPSSWVMKITGHKSEKSFWKYVRLSKEENAELMKDYVNKI